MTVQTSTSMPTDVSYGKVVGRFIHAVADASDTDRLPDAIATVGNVIFTPAQPNIKTDLPVPTTVVKSLIRCSINGNGEVIDPMGGLGVWLVTGVYKVSYDLSDTQLPTHNIQVLSTHDDEHPLDLSNSLPFEGPTLTPSQYEILSARIDALTQQQSL